MTCPWEERVSALTDGELAGDAAEAVRERLAGCGSCARWLGDVLGERYAREQARYRERRLEAERRELRLAAVAVVLSLGALAFVLVSLWGS